MSVSRKKAQTVITTVFGPDYFARKPTKTQPGVRCEIGRWTKSGKLEKVASGDTWLQAIVNAATALDRKDVLTSAAEVKRLVTTD